MTTHKQLLALSPREKRYRHFVGESLYLNVFPNGTKSWGYKFYFSQAERSISLGQFPSVSLKQAREAKVDTRRLIDKGIDPVSYRKRQKMHKKAREENQFQYVSLEWLHKSLDDWSDLYGLQVGRLKENYLDTAFNKRPIDEISPPELLEVLRKIEARGTLETAQRVFSIASRIFRYAVATGRVKRDITTDLRGALKTPKPKHLAAITCPKEFGQFLKKIDEYWGTPQVANALRMAPHVFVRPGELRKAKWSEFDFIKRRWLIPAERMKMRADHIVPLTPQVIAILEDQRQYSGKRQYVFPSPAKPQKPLSENALPVALKKLGYGEKASAHGFRASARTLLDEELQFPIDWIEQQLAHQVRDSLGRAYNRTTHIKGRTDMMTAWSNYLDELKHPHQ
ncbi:Prophage integrase IntA [BD1-7 clade bacterium]|uniref:Prophage integrase IntA n=1 Tax=BD1-7 clade bacterium TaxID=2029982 RepID=A0A5S9PCI4_9GAMM|nr:Prophage integrase IntA [BD1-7 clade bacterium]CAA0101580.1 Prophage integrase IntA [BD1-7 clade bacterium]